jgi:thymidylate kinase
MKSDQPVIGVVGPCAAGKSTLVKELRERGIQVRHIAQEHSYVQDMWRQIAKPDILIYLDVSFEISKKRSDASWTRDIYQNQLDRLLHARDNADVYIATDDKTPQQVFELVIDAIGPVD